jgi:phosphatidylinositol dimannoside acyltransferase
VSRRIPAVVRVHRLAALLARLVPRRAIPALSAAVGAVLGLRHDDARVIIERNLARVLGHPVSARARRRHVRATYASYARYYLESFKLPSLGFDAVTEDFTVEGFAHIHDAIERHAGPILALPHLGGWEWAGFWLALVPKLSVSAVAEALEPPELAAWFTELRARLGMEVILLGPDAGGAVNRAIRANHVTCLLCDRHVGGAGVEVEFFGERTTLPAGPVTLALRTGAPLLPTAVYFDGRGHHSVVRPPVPLERTGRLRDDIARGTQLLARELEILIRAAPEQWHLLQPNWPSDHVALGRPAPPPASVRATVEV